MNIGEIIYLTLLCIFVSSMFGCVLLAVLLKIINKEPFFNSLKILVIDILIMGCLVEFLEGIFQTIFFSFTKLNFKKLKK